MRPAAKLAIIGTSTALAAAGAWFARDKIRMAAAGTLAKPGSSRGFPQPVPRASSDPAAQRAVIIAERLRRLWPDVTGESGPMPEAALEIALAQGWLESGLAVPAGGGWWKDKTDKGQGDMRGSGNLGARHCGKGDTGGAYYKCVPYGDSTPQPDGTNRAYDVSFRFYTGGNCGGKDRDAGDCAAYDFLQNITKQWPALAELKSGDVLAYAMRQGPPYRAADKPDQKVYGRPYKGGNGYYGGFGATMEERVGGYAQAILSHLPAVAAALGHDRIHAKIAPELLAPPPAKKAPAVAGFEPGNVPLEGIAGTLAATVAAVIAALVVHGLVTGNDGESKAADAIGALRSAGFEVVQPGAKARAGWVKVKLDDPRLLAALDYLGSKRDAVLRHILGQGYAFEIRRAGFVLRPKKRDKTAPPATTTPSSTSSPPALEEDRLPLRTLPQAAPPAQSSPPALDEDRGSLSAPPTAPPAADTKLTRADMKVMFPTYTDAQIDDALKNLQGATLSGEADVTAADAAASDAYAVAKSTGQLEGAGTVAAVVAGGLAAGALVAAAISHATSSTAPPAAPPAPAKAAPKAAAKPAAAPAPKTAPAPPPASSSTPSSQPYGPPLPPDWPADVQPMGPVGPTGPTAAAVMAGDAGELVMALHLAGAWPRARALPETGELHWYIEDPSREQLAALAGADAELPELVPIDAVVSAHNEEATVADVARALILSGAYGRVIVVDDGSTDRTADRARAAGAEVVRLPENKGKTGAMLAGAITSHAPAVAFFDADALNMTPEHGRTLARAFHAGRFAQVCGVLDDGVLNTSRIATGQRIVDRRVLDAIPVNCQGYAAETAINAIADKIGRTQEVRLAGLKYRTKRDKVGTLQGTLQGARMAVEMTEAAAALATSGGTSCKLGESPGAVGLPPATVAEMQRAAGLPEHVVEQTRRAVPELAPELRDDLARLATAEAAQASTTTDRRHLQAIAAELAEAPPAGELDGAASGVIVGLVLGLVTAAAGKYIEERIQDTRELQKAKRVVGSLRAAGIDLLAPNAAPHAGWISVSGKDADLLEALSFLGSQRDEVLREIVEAGYSFQKRPAGAPAAPPAAKPAHVAGHQELDELGAARPKGDAKKGDAGDDALATAGDVADAAAAAVSLISAGKRIAERGVQDPDPECRKTVREWVANHPILARLFKSPDLTKLAGIEGTDDEGRFRDSFADAYMRALADMRGSPELGAAGEDCAVCETEDRAVLAHLGVSQQEVDAIYNVAASSGSTIADLFAPGVGKGLRQTADAVKELANPQARKPKKGGESQAAACQRELDKTQADLTLARQWVQRHPILVAITSPSMARLAGEDEGPETTTGRTALSSGVVTVTAKE